MAVVRLEQVRDGVVEPWIMDTASGKETASLEKTLEDWQDAQKK